MIKSLLIAFQFLTIIPVRKTLTANENDIAKSASVFVIVGFIQGILLMVTDYASGIFFHQDLVIAIVLLVLVLSNGGFHLDGLADTFDAIAVKSSGNFERDKEKKLSVMKDSSTGAIGTIAILFAILLKYLSIKNISHLTPITYYSALLFMPAISKWTMVISMFHGKSARKDGLGQIFMDRTGPREISIATFSIIFIFVLLAIFFSHFSPYFYFAFYVVLLAAMYILSNLCVIFFNKTFGGLTGDTLGAISELTEISFLFMVIIWSRLSI